MSHANLTARYRPQTFASLAGQDTVRAILSRAAAEDRVAPAYLFSGTRGVGKTTVARIFAKALNCERAPGPEPCNACERCRQITAGTAVDVVEIDGASNRGIDDVRRLKEVVGYAPMDARYKVFIIDEAHMLSRDAFNALLKTLEEPPARVTFIMATTEAHKFPATILSRCQHFVFKRLPEGELEAHLASVLERENVPFDESAVRLIARRAAGSVRDGMSLLGQVLALGGERLTGDDTRRVLGLAGQEIFFRLFEHLREGDTLAITALVREMLDSGLDLGFFLRELAASWRILFMLGQAGDAAIPLLDIPAADAGRWKECAASFDAAHVHAAWQMTLDGQRRVLTSLEPALALELLLLNLALLPRLLSMDQLSARMRRAAPSPGSGPASAGSGGSAGSAGSGGPAVSGGSGGPAVSGGPAGSGGHGGPGGAARSTGGTSGKDAQAASNPPERRSGTTGTAERDADPSSPASAAFSRNPGAPATAGEPVPPPAATVPGDAAPVACGGSACLRETQENSGQDAARALTAEDAPREMPGVLPDMPPPFPRMGPEQAEGVPPEEEPVLFESESPVPEGYADIEPEYPIPENGGPRSSGPDESGGQDGPGGPDGLDGPFVWEDFVAYCAARKDISPGFLSVLRSQRAEEKDSLLEITPDTAFSSGQLEGRIKSGYLAGLVRGYCGREYSMRLLPPARRLRRMTELREEMRAHPGVALLEKHMGARMIDCGRIHNPGVRASDS